MKTRLGILYGALIGAAIPLVLVGIVYVIFLILDLDTASNEFQKNVMESTILLGCGANLGIMLWAFGKTYDYVGRGIVIATFVYFIYWVFQFV